MENFKKKRKAYLSGPKISWVFLASVSVTLLFIFTPSCGRQPVVFGKPIFVTRPDCILDVPSPRDMTWNNLSQCIFLATAREPGIAVFIKDENSNQRFLAGWSATEAGKNQIQDLNQILAAAEKNQLEEDKKSGEITYYQQFIPYSLTWTLQKIDLVEYLIKNGNESESNIGANEQFVELKAEILAGNGRPVLPVMVDTFFGDESKYSSPFAQNQPVQKGPLGLLMQGRHGRIRINLFGVEGPVSYLRLKYAGGGVYFQLPSGIERIVEKRWRGRLEAHYGDRLLITQNIKGYVREFPALVFYDENMLVYRYRENGSSGDWKAAIYFFKPDKSPTQSQPIVQIAPNSSHLTHKKVILKKHNS